MRDALLALMTIVAMAGCRRSEAPRTPTAHAGWPSAFVQSNGVRLHYWRTGGGRKPAIVMAHGITDYGLNWTSLAEKLERDHDVVMYDARGHGFSDKPKGRYDLASHVEDLVAW